MHPILVDLGPLTVYSYGFFIAAAILLGMGLAMHEARQKDLNPRLVLDLGFYLILGAVVGSRLLYVLLHPVYFFNRPLEIVQFWKGGLVFIGGVIVAVIVAWIYLKQKEEPFLDWLDTFAPGAAAGQALGRIGCLMAGCCYGKPADLPWALTFMMPNSLAPLHLPLHPTQIYHSLAGLVTFVLLVLAKRKDLKSGQLFALFLVLYSFFRFVIEFFRGDYRGYLGFLSTTQWITIVVFIIGVSIILKLRSQ
ncbi:MAG: prolipoprotein diacylglyceryl transferase [Thermodesulfobacteriota bacterium]